MWCFGCCKSSDDDSEEVYEVARCAPPPQLTSPIVEHVEVNQTKMFGQSLCPLPKALCDGRVHSLLDQSAFDPPLCSTKLVSDDKKAHSDSDISAGKSLSESFWNDIKRWGPKQSIKRSNSENDGRHSFLTVSSDFSRPIDIPSYDVAVPALKKELLECKLSRKQSDAAYKTAILTSVDDLDESVCLANKTAILTRDDTDSVFKDSDVLTESVYDVPADPKRVSMESVNEGECVQFFDAKEGLSPSVTYHKKQNNDSLNKSVRQDLNKSVRQERLPSESTKSVLNRTLLEEPELVVPPPCDEVEVSLSTVESYDFRKIDYTPQGSAIIRF